MDPCLARLANRSDADAAPGIGVRHHAVGPAKGVERDGRFLLMELEINEPVLYIGSSDGAAERFADAIVRTTTRSSDSRP